MADLLTSALPQLSLTDPLASMDQLHEVLLRRAQQLMDWYAGARTGKRFWARNLRLGSILFGSAATLVPMIVSIVNAVQSGHRYTDVLLPASSVFGLLAATCLLLDRFFGCSSSWMRYTVTHLELRARAETFHLAWQSERLKLVAATEAAARAQAAIAAASAPANPANPPPAAAPPPVQYVGPDPQVAVLEAVRAAHALHQAFLEAINGLEKSETQDWITEFKGALNDLERRIDEQRSAAVSSQPGRGAVRVVVEGAVALEGDRFELRVDDEDAMVFPGQSAVLTRVVAGLRTVQVSATRKGGVRVMARDVVRVESNQITEARLKLPAA